MPGFHEMPLEARPAQGTATHRLVLGTQAGKLLLVPLDHRLADSKPRQFGGQVSGGTLYRVNETGRPEMFTASNGTQYMLPTADGRVVPANQVGAGGGAGVQINVHNYAGADIQATASPDGRIVEIAVRQAKAEIAQEIASNTGQTWQALRSATNIKPALGA